MRISLFLVLALSLLGGCASTDQEVTVPEFPTHPETRFWIDMDPACDERLSNADPDDCLAYFLAKRAGMNIVGISTTGGNANERETWSVAQRLVHRDVPLYRGIDRGDGVCASDAVRAMRNALIEGPLRIIALGPLTNIAHLLRCYPESQENIEDIIFVGSRFLGEEFVVNPNWLISFELRDLNVVEDIQAVEFVLQHDLRLRYVPFQAGIQLSMYASELVAQDIQLPDYLYTRLYDWGATSFVFLGADGFIPFDSAAIALALWPQKFSCVPVHANIVSGDLITKLHQGGVHQHCTPRESLVVKRYILGTLTLP